MKPCRHDNADHLHPGEGVAWEGPLDGLAVTVEQFRCVDCGAYLSLGKANDTRAVLVEIRAAEIADAGEAGRLVYSYCELYGHGDVGYLWRIIAERKRRYRSKGERRAALAEDHLTHHVSVTTELAKHRTADWTKVTCVSCLSSKPIAGTP